MREAEGGQRGTPGRAATGASVVGSVPCAGQRAEDCGSAPRSAVKGRRGR